MHDSANASGPSWLHFSPDQYDDLLAAKVADTRAQFAPWLREDVPFTVYATEPEHFRSRARFAMIRTSSSTSVEGPERVAYAVFDGGGPSVVVESFPIASREINRLMPRLLDELNATVSLTERLSAVHFLGTQSGDMLVSLIYQGSPMPAGWRAAAEGCRTRLELPSLVGRCKGHFEVIGRDWVSETIRLSDGRELRYKQVEGSFSNPSATMCGHTLDFLSACAQEASLPGGGAPPPTLLELYCGNGNHTVALARFFSKILAVEIDRKLCDAAEFNLEQNGVGNGCVLCASSGNFCQRLLRSIRKVRKYGLPPEPADGAPLSREEAWMRDAQRSTDVILVDPPRCGLDDDTRELIQLYDHILYVSCNPPALRADLERLGDAYELRRFAVFDHFAYSNHLEVAVHVRRRR